MKKAGSKKKERRKVGWGEMISEPRPDICTEFSELESRYTLGPLLGAGAYSEVYECTSKESGEKFAVKVTLKGKKGIVASVQQEFEVLKILHHPNIIRSVELLESVQKFYLITELVEGVDLLPKILSSQQYYCEAEASRLLTQLLSAVRYIHGRGVVHRDLKPQNMIFTNSDLVSSLKLVDFGSAITLQAGETATQVVGTVKFMAPEMIRLEPYTEKIDIWAVGVILYIMLTGREPFPFEGEELRRAIQRGAVDLSLDFLSADAVGLLQGLLEVNPEKRLSAEAALAHQWLHPIHPSARRKSTAVMTPIRAGTVAGLQALSHRLSRAHALAASDYSPDTTPDGGAEDDHATTPQTEPPLSPAPAAAAPAEPELVQG
eukprot:RCo041529